MGVPHLAALSDSAEALITRQFFALVRADAVLAGPGGFDPWVLVESPAWDGFLDMSHWTGAMQPWSAKQIGEPSHRTVLEVGILVACYLPSEQTEEDSELFWWRILNRLRILSHALVLRDPVTNRMITFATTNVETPRPIVDVNRGTKIFTYLVVFQTDIDPRTGEFDC